jgi:hypothetical protein
MKFGFIAKHRSVWPVAWLREARGVSKSGFHAWLKPSRCAPGLGPSTSMIATALTSYDPALVQSAGV